MFEYCPKHDKRHWFAKPHPFDPPAKSPNEVLLQEYGDAALRRVKKPQGTGAIPPPPRRFVHEHEYRRRGDESFADGVLVGAIASSILHSDPAPSVSSEPSWSGGGGSFSGGGASDSWGGSDTSSSSSDSSSSDSGSSFDSSSSSGGGDF